MYLHLKTEGRICFKCESVSANPDTILVAINKQCNTHIKEGMGSLAGVITRVVI